ncbi:MAG: hypothetical protein AAF492_15830 [Verrucomicrobiota bacterium]
MRTSYYTLIAIGLSWTGSIQAGQFDTYQEKFEAKLASINNTYAGRTDAVKQEYQTALDGLLIKTRREGDLDGTMMVMEEAGRFKADGFATKSSTHPEIAKVQKGLKAKLQNVVIEKSKQVYQLYQSYERALEKLQKTLVSQNVLVEAGAVQTARRELLTDSGYLQARRYAAMKPVPLPGAVPKKPAATNGSAPKRPQVKLARVSDVNLLRNPSNEEKIVKNDIPGWDEVKGSDWGKRTSNPKARLGKNYFFAGKTAVGELSQTVDVSSLRSNIQTGRQKFKFEAYLTSWENAMDVPKVVMEFLDASKSKVLEDFDSGPQRSRMNWIRIQNIAYAPPQTHYIRIRLITQRYDGKNNDGYFDAIELMPVN